MCWPRLEGGLEIEERYPRTNDPREPRRKRLNFVRERSSARSSDDHALVYSSFHQTRPIRNDMRERHDPHVLQQQEQYMRQLQGQNQQLQGQNQHLHRLMWEEQQRRRHEIEMAQQQHGHIPPPPPPGRIAHHEQPRIMHHPHEGLPPGVERVEEPHLPPNVVEVRPRSRMPNNVHHGRSPSRGRSHRRHHSGGSIYSDDRDSWKDYDRRRRGRSPLFYGSSHDSFDDLLPGHGPHRRR
ncbi:MAG: hypothetical protein Q9225_000862 [Loekoesia sp. 1 TL-2023]